MLGLSQEDVAGNRPLEPRLEAAGIIQQYERLSLVRQPVHEGGRDHDVAETDQPADMMQRHLEFPLPLDVDADGRVVQVGVGLRRHDIEGVLDGMQLIPLD